MRTKTLVVPRVDLELLEFQRLQLVGLEFNEEAQKHMTGPQKEALVGVVNMLDAWSDGRRNE